MPEEQIPMLKATIEVQHGYLMEITIKLMEVRAQCMVLKASNARLAERLAEPADGTVPAATPAGSSGT